MLALRYSPGHRLFLFESKVFFGTLLYPTQVHHQEVKRRNVLALDMGHLPSAEPQTVDQRKTEWLSACSCATRLWACGSQDSRKTRSNR